MTTKKYAKIKDIFLTININILCTKICKLKQKVSTSVFI